MHRHDVQDLHACNAHVAEYMGKHLGMGLRPLRLWGPQAGLLQTALLRLCLPLHMKALLTVLAWVSIAGQQTRA